MISITTILENLGLMPRVSNSLASDKAYVMRNTRPTYGTSTMANAQRQIKKLEDRHQNWNRILYGQRANQMKFN